MESIRSVLVLAFCLTGSAYAGKGGRPANVPDDYVAAPGHFGYFHPTCFYELEKGDGIDAQAKEIIGANGKHRPMKCEHGHFDIDGNPVPPGTVGLGPTARQEEDEFVSWGSDQLITWASADWTVPSNPVRISDQWIAFWNGLEPWDQTYVIQPALSWNENWRGRYWTMANWYVQAPDSTLAKTADIQVWPGQVISGYMYQNNGYNYFTGYNINGAYADGMYTILPTYKAPMWYLGGVLESYNLYTCNELPPDNGMTMRYETINVWGSPRTPGWSGRYNGDTPYCNFAAVWGSGSQVGLVWNAGW